MAGPRPARAYVVAALAVAIAGTWLCSSREGPPVPTGANTEALSPEDGFTANEEVQLDRVDLEGRGTLEGVVPRTRFECSGVVLKNGRDSDGAMDVDITLAYGRLARAEVLAAIHEDWDGYRFDDAPFDAPYFRSHVTRFHVVAASENVRCALRARKRGDAVRLRGYLVDLRRSGRLVEGNLEPGVFLCKCAYVTQVVTTEHVFE